MKKIAKILLPVLAILLITAVFAIPSFAADTVIYVSDKGTGDGSSADQALGHDAGYNATTGPANNYHKSALYRALDSIKATGGTVVICGPTTIEYAPANDDSASIADKSGGNWRTPIFEAGKSVTITSVYGGTDYRKDGAALVYDSSKTNPRVHFRSESVWENITLKVVYDTAYWSAGTPVISFTGNKTIIGDGITCVQFDKNLETSTANRYPVLVAGNIWDSFSKDTNLTINSGTWYQVYASTQFGGANIPALQTGNANLTVNGGEIKSAIYGMTTQVNSGGDGPTSGRIDGNLNITINGGQISIVMMGRNGFVNADAVYTLKVSGGTFTSPYGLIFYANGGNPFPTGANTGTRIIDFSGLTEAEYKAAKHSVKIAGAVTSISFEKSFDPSVEIAGITGASGPNPSSGFEQVILPGAGGATTTAAPTGTTTAAPTGTTTAKPATTTAAPTGTTTAKPATTTTAKPTTTAGGTGAPATSATTITILAIMAGASIAVAGTVLAGKKRED